MKLANAFTTFTLLTTLCFSSFIVAEDQVVPVVTKPSALQEGTQRVLSPEQVKELIPWAKNSKVFLNDLLNTIAGLSSADKLDRLEDGIKSVVGESAPKNSELLMRYVLNRGLVINDLLKTEMSADEVGTIDTKLRVLVLSIKMAITYYDTDMQTLNQKTNAPFITFGVQYFDFLSELNKSIFDASASYNIQRTALEWLQWDLYRDLNNQQVASQIVKINNSLKIYPIKKMSDAQYISYIRQMKLMSQQLELNPGSVKPTKNITHENDSTAYNDSSVSSGVYISQCAKTFGADNYKNACIDFAKLNKLDPQLIQLCGKVLSSDPKRYDCLAKMVSQTATRYNVEAYSICGSSFGDSAYKLSCIDSVNNNSPRIEDMNACGSSFGTDYRRDECLGFAGQNNKVENLSDYITTCSSIMGDSAYKIMCVTYSVSYSTSLESIKACGSTFGSDSSRYKCLEYVSATNPTSDASKTVKACGALMGDSAYKNTCISTGLTMNLSPSAIRSCGVMSTDSSRDTCLGSL